MFFHKQCRASVPSQNCASSASDLSVYDMLKRDIESESLDLPNSEGQSVCYLFNNSQSQLWLDGARFYGFNICKRYQAIYNFRSYFGTSASTSLRTL